MKKLLAALAASVLLLVGCSTPGAEGAKTAPQTIYQIEGNYRAALKVAVTYKNLPPCGTPVSPILCSKPEVVQKLQTADDVAYPLLQAAEKVVRTPGATNIDTVMTAAQAAVEALTAITLTLNIQ